MSKEKFTISAGTGSFDNMKVIADNVTMEEFGDKLNNNLNAHINGGKMIKVLKAKIKYDNLECGYREDGDIISRQSSKKVHADLFDTYKKLIPHLVILCDMRELIEGAQPEDYNLEALHNISVTSFSIGGEDEHEGITITGQKRIGKKVLNLNSPFTKWDDEFAPYEYSDELKKAVNDCIREIILYLNGKYAPDAQTKLEFEETT